MFAYDIYRALERIVLDYVTDANDRAKYLEDLKVAKGLYRERVMTEMFNAYMDEPQAIRNHRGAHRRGLEAPRFSGAKDGL